MKPAWVMLAAGVLLAGCWLAPGGGARPEAGDRLLIDAGGGGTSRVHCRNVPDPFGGGGQVIAGELVEKDMHKTTLLHAAGFFAVPGGGRADLVVRLAVKGERKVRIGLVNDQGTVKSFYRELPEENQWIALRLPLEDVLGKLPAGEKIVDISIWQLGGGKSAALYVDRLLLHPR
jgi:hypothetical protein